MKKILIYFSLFALLFSLLNCGIYSFTGVQTNAKTFQVNRIENNALLVEPGLERDFQIALEDLIQNQTNLSLVKSNADLVYEGEITDYRISPTTSTSEMTAAQNRLTITVKIRFFNRIKEDDDLDQSFSFFYDYTGSAQLMGGLKDTAHGEIIERLTQDIINATLAKW
ncbi:MAG: LptE family protein [Aestuariibaculum sp.]